MKHDLFIFYLFIYINVLTKLHLEYYGAQTFIQHIMLPISFFFQGKNLLPCDLVENLHLRMISNNI